jgi:uncharacterized membrane protein YraQ (UPF0718 family)
MSNEDKKQTESCCSADASEHKHQTSCSSDAQCATSAEATAGSCCGSDAAATVKTEEHHHDHGSEEASCCAPKKKGRPDLIMWSGGIFVLLAYAGHLFFNDSISGVYAVMAHTGFEMMNAMWWGILAGALAVGALGRIPNDMVMAVLGKGGTKRGVVRATLAGLLLDLCNHGILMVAMGLYRKGASLGQVMAFIIASPWNSLTLTLILIGLIGLPWTLAFIVFSMLIAWVSGMLFDQFEKKGVLPANPHATPHNEEFELWPELKSHLKKAEWTPSNIFNVFWEGLKESKMVVRWVLFGVLLVALVRAFVDPEQFGIWFGATLGGLFLTLVATTLMEVCSEGSSPIAADLVTRANAPGNGFVFLMAGAATDYTEIMSLRDTTKSWKIALFLPLVTVPQILVLGYIMNQFA